MELRYQACFINCEFILNWQKAKRFPMNHNHLHSTFLI